MSLWEATNFAAGDFLRGRFCRSFQPRQERGRLENYNFCNAAGHASTWWNNKKGHPLVARGPGVGDPKRIGFRWNFSITIFATTALPVPPLDQSATESYGSVSVEHFGQQSLLTQSCSLVHLFHTRDIHGDSGRVFRPPLAWCRSSNSA